MLLHEKYSHLTAENDELARQVDYLLRERLHAKRRERGSEAYGGEGAADDPGEGTAGGLRSNEGAVNPCSFGHGPRLAEAVTLTVRPEVVFLSPRP
ncbi:protein of unknown function [Methylorubrum extorquens DM4]|uniref:Transposase n=1 Tax=Methylorubrum extorquens (strain DSM 6343 / CIP 106787 / DM4) TaxID=661410 RepID=C7C8F0_METED|nr:hypothetical protein [Methylorubrum extorquens]CAX24217.1 protein of unknown function [Methylorubrum extorquens DM4]